MSTPKDPFKIRFCIVCGRRIPTNSNRYKICSNHCAQRRKALARKGKPAPFEYATEPPAQAFTLGEINAEARKLGISYGEYMDRRRKGLL